LPYFHIDPLKINVSAVTEVFSSAYAARFKILPVGITSKEAVIATAQPYISEYEKELKQILKLDIKRVVANPGDIERYVSEFYNLARSIKKAAGAGGGVGRCGCIRCRGHCGGGQQSRRARAGDTHEVPTAAAPAGQ